MKLLKAYLIPLFMFLPIILSARPISVAESSTRSSITLIILIGEFSYGAKGPFGQVIAKSETVENPFQFQTKYYDKETGLSYYGYRYYDPIDGRWVNKDPIGIDGGINLYNSVSNNMVNGFVGGENYSSGMDKYLGYLDKNYGVDPWGLEKLPQIGYKVIEEPKVIINNGWRGSWGVEWTLTPKTKRGGIIMQHVDVKFDVDDCHGKKVDFSNEAKDWPFWEFWIIWPDGNVHLAEHYQVPNFTHHLPRGTQVDFPKDYKINKLKASDTFAFSLSKKKIYCTKGSVTITGMASFFDDKDSPVTRRYGTPAGVLPSTKTDPKLGKASSGTIKHEIIYHWDFCPGKEKAWATVGDKKYEGKIPDYLK
jgi:RHS repeat-associated protein